jgi:hypothetical protein
MPSKYDNVVFFCGPLNPAYNLPPLGLRKPLSTPIDNPLPEDRVLLCFEALQAPFLVFAQLLACKRGYLFLVLLFIHRIFHGVFGRGFDGDCHGVSHRVFHGGFHTDLDKTSY